VVHWLVPREVRSIFTGREELVRTIKSAVLPDREGDPSTQKRFVITGMGGQGKSEICLKVAHELRDRCVSTVAHIVSVWSV
jgi:hypothetical protein